MSTVPHVLPDRPGAHPSILGCAQVKFPSAAVHVARFMHGLGSQGGLVVVVVLVVIVVAVVVVEVVVGGSVATCQVYDASFETHPRNVSNLHPSSL